MSKNNDIQELTERMENENVNDEIQINWKAIGRRLKEKRKLFLITSVVVVVVSYLLALSVPKHYIVKVKLAPEFSSMTNTNAGVGTLSSLMKSFGIGQQNNQNGDAILPTLYPDLMNSNLFLVSLFDIPVQTKDGKVKTAYYDYLANNQKTPWWSDALDAVVSLISEHDGKADTYKDANAAALTKKQTKIATAISKKIQCDVDQKTGVITIMVKDQDPLICTAIADSTCQRLQEFITEYRTKKARIELDNAQVQCDKAQAEYEEAKREVEAFSDSNWDLVDEDFKVEEKSLENEMQLKFSTYSALNSQLIAARSKYEGLRPVYTVLDGASVPIKPAGPSRMKFVFIMLMIVLIAEFAWVMRGSKETIVNK